MAENEQNQVINMGDFSTQSANVKSSLLPLIRYVAREVNRQKLDYNQLKYIFKAVRAKCDVAVPNTSKKLIELPSDAEITQFMTAIKNPIHTLIFETLLNTGLRVAELCALEVSRIDFDKNTVMVINGKGGKDRKTVIGNKLKEKLLLYLESRNNRYLFESERNTKFSTRRIQQLCQKYRTLSGVTKELRCHTFRHLWNTKLAENGVSREGREILAGHSKGSATQDIYTHLGVGGIKNDVIAILDGEV